MVANVYRLLRNAISDNVSDYLIPDPDVLVYLDKAIDKLSDICRFTFKESITITQQDLTAGYKDLSHDIQLIQKGWLSDSLVGVVWDYAGGKRIRFIDTSAIPTGSYTIWYRAKYKKFGGIILSQDEMEIPAEAEFPVVLYAIGLYTAAKASVFGADGSFGIVRTKAEEGMRVEYGIDGGSIQDLISPQAMASHAIKLMRDLPMAESMFFSVKI